ncbi:MAG TPA: CopD family protein [Puia sp.]|nr:CopD family protein [Puia sp.]
MYNYIKALHIIFVVTWFSGLFYIVRLFVYHAEAEERNTAEKTLLQQQFRLMIRRLWLGITWPSAILTLIFGPWMMVLMGSVPVWLEVKIGFVVLLYLYHFSLQMIFRQQMKGIFRWSSRQLRIWNEVATIFLVTIVMLATVKSAMSWAWGLTGLILFVILLMSAIRIYKLLRQKGTKR